MNAYVSGTLKTPLHNLLNAHYNLGMQDVLDGMLDPNADKCVVEPVNPEAFQGRMWLLAGSQLLFKFEPFLTGALEDQSLKDSNVKSLGMINYILNKLAEAHSFDVVVIDLSPSNSSINQVAALSSDYLLPPCNASLYSCGSVNGFLENVLPQWLSFHKRLAEKQWSDEWSNSENGKRLAPFRLPATPPVLLPILVNNYGMEKSADNLGKRSEKKQKVEPHIRFQPSQFIYTILDYLDELHQARKISMGKGPAEPGEIRFRTHNGRMVLPFCPSAPVSIAATEALGRPFVEITLEQFSNFYGFEPDEFNDQVIKLSRQAKIVKQLVQNGLLDSLDVTANDTFDREVKQMRVRYQSFARFLLKNVFPERRRD
eukprot:scaffold239029_cov28-Tisochrysis_lutea.AAC.1